MHPHTHRLINRLARTRLAGGHAACASDDSGKSAYMHAHVYTQAVSVAC